jgi:hypothetical protein
MSGTLPHHFPLDLTSWFSKIEEAEEAEEADSQESGD